MASGYSIVDDQGFGNKNIMRHTPKIIIVIIVQGFEILNFKLCKHYCRQHLHTELRMTVSVWPASTVGGVLRQSYS